MQRDQIRMIFTAARDKLRCFTFKPDGSDVELQQLPFDLGQNRVTKMIAMPKPGKVDGFLIFALTTGQIGKWDLDQQQPELLGGQHTCKILSLEIHNNFILSGDENGNVQVRDVSNP